MELYSTVLWQLRKEIDISYLAQTAIGLDRLDPRSWCIMGNCFSLQKVCAWPSSKNGFSSRMSYN